MTVNERYAKISKALCVITDELDIDQEVYFKGVGSVTKSEDKSNQDGTIDRVFTIKAFDMEVKKKE